MYTATLSVTAVVVGAGLATSAFAQAQPAVQFRIVERTSQTVANAADAVLDFAVQAAVTPGAALGGFSFDVRLTGEPEANGTFERASTTLSNGTYDPGFSTGNTVGRFGLARQYSYFAGVNPNFNGLINQSGGTFTNTADNEIGIVTGYPGGTGLLGVPGMDTDNDGNPDTWSGNGSGMTPANGATAALPAALAGAYFGNGQFIDVYRFRYTVSNLTARTLHFTLQNVAARQFGQMEYNNGLWGITNLVFQGAPTINNLDIQVVPGPGAGAGVLMLGVALVARRRR